MAKSTAGKPPKPTRAEKKAARKASRAQFAETVKLYTQAFGIARKGDPKFLPLFIMIVVLAAAITYAIVLLVTGSIWFGIPFALLVAVAAGLIFFTRRAQRATFAQAEGTPGAAAWVLENSDRQLRGDWRRETAVAANTQFDAVHRLIGKAGVVLVGEGSPQRVRGLIAQEKKRIARIAGDTPIYDIVVGNGDGEVPLGKLVSALNKLPNNLSKPQIGALDKRLQALGGRRPPLPQGPMPAGAKMRNVQRAARRHT
jgi:hypothetical protein